LNFADWQKNFPAKNHRCPLTVTPSVASNRPMAIVVIDAVSDSTFDEGSEQAHLIKLPFPFTQT